MPIIMEGAVTNKGYTQKIIRAMQLTNTAPTYVTHTRTSQYSFSDMLRILLVLGEKWSSHIQLYIIYIQLTHCIFYKGIPEVCWEYHRLESSPLWARATFQICTSIIHNHNLSWLPVAGTPCFTTISPDVGHQCGFW